MALWGNTPDQKPKYLNATDANNTILVDAAMSETTGLTQGWNLVTTYTSHDGSTRNRRECLVALAEATIPTEE